jgi:hypothetical protein
MTHHNETHKASTETRKRVFVSHAQVLPKDKHHTLSEQAKAFETTCESRGVWLDVFCPDSRCEIDESTRLT